MNSVVFTWKMMSVAVTTLIVSFVVGFITPGNQPARLQQKLATHINKNTITTLPVVKDSASVNKNRASKKNSAKSITRKQFATIKHKIPANDTLYLPDTNVVAPVKSNLAKTAAAQNDDSQTPLNEMLVMSITSQKDQVKKTDAAPVVKTDDHIGISNDMFAIPVAKAATAHPEAGWSSFRTYLNDRAISPDGKTGTVKLLFTVNDNGSLTGFKVENSLSDAANQKAIALVKNGPTWVGSDNKQAKEVTVTVVFHAEN